MDPQQQQVFEYSQQMNVVEQQVESSQQVATQNVAPSTTSYQEPHVLDRPPHVNLATPFENLEVLCELLIDFDNLKTNGMDLTQELETKGGITTSNDFMVPFTYSW